MNKRARYKTGERFAPGTYVKLSRVHHEEMRNTVGRIIRHVKIRDAYLIEFNNGKSYEAFSENVDKVHI